MIRALTLAMGCVSLLALPAPSSAEWTGGLQVGTELGSSSPTIRLDARNNTTPLSHYLFLDWSRGDNGNNYRVGYHPRYQISNSFYSFVRLGVESSEDSGITSDSYALLGAGNTFVRSRSTGLSVEGGIGIRRLELESSTIDPEAEPLLFLGLQLRQALAELIQIDGGIRASLLEDETRTDASAGLSFRLSGNSALRAGYRVRRYEFNDAREDILDEDSSLSITYGF